MSTNVYVFGKGPAALDDSPLYFYGLLCHKSKMLAVAK